MKKTNKQPSIESESVTIVEESTSGADTPVQDKRVKDKATVLDIIGIVWSLLTTTYMIFSICLLIAKGWVSHGVTYALIAILAVYVIAFIVVIVYVFKHPHRATAKIKTYKKTLALFKAISNFALLILAAVSLSAMTRSGEMTAGKWIVFVMSILVATVQLILKTTQLILRLTKRHIIKKYSVHTERFVDGKRKKRTAKDVINDNKYKP